MKNYIAYIVALIVIVLSASLAAFLPLPDDIKTLFSLPTVGGLFMLLIKGWRDQVAHERALELQQKQNDFSLAIASHMANVVFDKQVEFCEKYAKELNSIILELSRKNPLDVRKSYRDQLREIRIEYSPWVSKELTEKVKPFEMALVQIAALSMLERTDPNDPDRPKYIKEMYKIYGKFLGISMEGVPDEPESAADAVIEHFSEVLNTFDLEALRRKAIQLAKNQA